MRYVLLIVLCLSALPCQAEPFTVWEQSSTIWARDEATDLEWQISRGANAHSPDVDGPVAVWIADWSYSADVMGINLPPTRVDWSIAVQPAVASEPQVSYLNLPGEYAYVAWRQDGGIWARRLRDLAPHPAEIVPNYAGPYTLEGRTLTWDGGSTDLHLPTPVPEPSMLLLVVLAAVAGLCLLCRRHQ